MGGGWALTSLTPVFIGFTKASSLSLCCGVSAEQRSGATYLFSPSRCCACHSLSFSFSFSLSFWGSCCVVGSATSSGVGGHIPGFPAVLVNCRCPRCHRCCSRHCPGWGRLLSLMYHKAESVAWSRCWLPSLMLSSLFGLVASGEIHGGWNLERQE